MPEIPITSIDVLKFIDGEFRTAARDVLELHSLEIEEREEKYRCLPVSHIGSRIFSFTRNSSKFRVGDYVLLNPHRKDMKGELIHVGDHQQMPPVIQGHHSGNPVNHSVFSYLIGRYPQLNTILDETRRMNREITAFPSTEYYGGRLKPIPEVRDRKLKTEALPDDPMLKTILDPENPVVFVHVDHEGYTQESPEEASLVARIVVELVSCCGIDPKDGLCVVAAHRRQNNLIREYIAGMVKKRKINKAVAKKLTSPDLVIDTVERIQGQERDVVVVSLTASDEEHIKAEKDFLMMPNRMNVSFTRPRTKLIVVGSKKLFRMIPADRDQQHEEVGHGRTVLRSEGITLSNHFKRWYFYVKESQRIVEATELASKLA